MTIEEKLQADVDTPSGPMRTYFFRPTAKGRFPGVILYSEIFQATSPILRTAAMIAGQGYLVAVPEVYHELEPAGTVLRYDQAGGTGAMRTNMVRSLLPTMRMHAHCSIT